jgi:hypothetical protein
MGNLNDLMNILSWNVDNDIGKQLKYTIEIYHFML